jgi:hypothetical protein
MTFAGRDKGFCGLSSKKVYKAFRPFGAGAVFSRKSPGAGLWRQAGQIGDAS